MKRTYSLIRPFRLSATGSGLFRRLIELKPWQGGGENHGYPEGDEPQPADGADVFLALQIEITLKAPAEKIIECLLLFAGEQELDAGSTFQDFVKREIGLVE